MMSRTASRRVPESDRPALSGREETGLAPPAKTPTVRDASHGLGIDEAEWSAVANNFSTIGLQLVTEAEYLALDSRLIAEADPARIERVPDGSYLPCNLGGGAEAWCHLRADGTSAGFIPHFAAENRFEVRLETRVRRPDEGPLDGAFVAYAVGHDGEDLYPFVFDVPDFRAFDGLRLPAPMPVAVAGFARDIEIYPDEQSFRATGSPMAVRSFIPAGMFEPGGATIDPPTAIAHLTGVVVASEDRTNSISRRLFRWIAVETYGAVLDIVVDHSIVSGAPPAAGAIVQATCWLAGRPIPSEVPRPGATAPSSEHSSG